MLTNIHQSCVAVHADAEQQGWFYDFASAIESAWMGTLSGLQTEEGQQIKQQQQSASSVAEGTAAGGWQCVSVCDQMCLAAQIRRVMNNREVCLMKGSLIFADTLRFIGCLSLMSDHNTGEEDPMPTSPPQPSQVQLESSTQQGNEDIGSSFEEAGVCLCSHALLLLGKSELRMNASSQTALLMCLFTHTNTGDEFTDAAAQAGSEALDSLREGISGLLGRFSDAVEP